MTLRVIEWHRGIGGASAALGPGVEVIAAVDNHLDAVSVYQQNFPDHRVYVKNIEKLTASQVARWGAADLWWMSPPCQPIPFWAKNSTWTIQGLLRWLAY